MYSTIAVGTDGSDTAEIAVNAAIDLAKRYDAKLVLLGAWDKDQRGAPDGVDDAHWNYSAADAVERVLLQAEAHAQDAGVQTQIASANGDPADTLVQLAEKHNADVLVIGNKGMHKRLLGSVPNTVTHKAPCSVLVVKTT
jgi:nucleotide-binding universal stress UspA family protein